MFSNLRRTTWALMNGHPTQTHVWGPWYVGRARVTSSNYGVTETDINERLCLRCGVRERSELNEPGDVCELSDGQVWACDDARTH